MSVQFSSVTSLCTRLHIADQSIGCSVVVKNVLLTSRRCQCTSSERLGQRDHSGWAAQALSLGTVRFKNPERVADGRAAAVPVPVRPPPQVRLKIAALSCLEVLTSRR